MIASLTFYIHYKGTKPGSQQKKASKMNKSYFINDFNKLAVNKVCVNPRISNVLASGHGLKSMAPVGAIVPQNLNGACIGAFNSITNL